MASPIVSPEMRPVKRAGECLGVLIEEGLNQNDLQAPIDDVQFRQELMRFWKSHGRSIKPVTETPSQARARQIMGKNFLGIEDAQNHFGVLYTAEELATLAEVPFSEQTLADCEANHVLFPGYPLTILDIRQRTKKKGRGVILPLSSDRDAWYNNEAFAKDERVSLRWYLIRRDTVEFSTSNTFESQSKLREELRKFPRGVYCPRACEVFYMTILYFLVMGNRLFEHIYVHCFDISWGGGPVCVGYFSQSGLRINYGNVWGTIAAEASEWRLFEAPRTT